MAGEAEQVARIVQKFGGTSLADIVRIKSVAERVKREVEAGSEVAVIVSAMAGVTNQLVAWTSETRAVSSPPTPAQAVPYTMVSPAVGFFHIEEYGSQGLFFEL